MSPTSALPALACLAVALATCEFLRRLGSARLPASRFVTIDGLRGYLAFFIPRDPPVALVPIGTNR
ncbi:hypothetical protein AAIH56_35185, partial [Pseudomonas aeruginosa]